MLSRRLSLTFPAYRGWLTPDAQEIRVRLHGFTEELLRAGVMHAVMTDADSERETRRFFELDPDGDEFVMPAPSFHSAGELWLYIEDRRDENVLAEQRWRLTCLTRDFAKRAVHFDDRGVMYRNGQAVVPRLWEPTDVDASALPTALADVRSAGFNGVLISRSGWTVEKIADVAKKAHAQGLTLSAPAVSDDRSPDAVRGRIRRLRDVPGLLGYVLPVDDPKDRGTDESYRVIRATDSTRPVFHLGTLPEGFDDVAVASVDATQSPVPAIKENCAIVFSRITASANLDPRNLRLAVYRSVAEGASGVIVSCPPNLLQSPVGNVVRQWAGLEKFVQLGSGEAITKADAYEFKQQGLLSWSRRVGDKAVLCVVNTGNVRVRAAVPAPFTAGMANILGENQRVPVQKGRIAVDLKPGDVHVFHGS